MSYTFNMDGLSISSKYPIVPSNGNLQMVPANADTLIYEATSDGDYDLVVDNTSGGNCTLLIWSGARPDALRIFNQCLASSCRLINSSKVLVLMLRVGEDYGCLESSIYIATGAIAFVEHQVGNTDLMRLDAMFEHMRRGGDIEECFGFMTDFNGPKLVPRAPHTPQDYAFIYDNFIKHFVENVESASNKYERSLELSLASRRKIKVRGYLSTLVSIGIQKCMP